MGLDMYLEKHTYIGNEYADQGERVEVKVPPTRDFKIDSARVSTIVEKVGYWRKANAIHRWFVENVQDGRDECQQSYVSREQLEELLSTVNKVLEGVTLKPGKVHTGTSWTKEEGKVEHYEDGGVVEDPSLAKELLPSQSGFFFGDTDYDQYYIQDLKDTKEILERALKEDSTHGDFYYRASW